MTKLHSLANIVNTDDTGLRRAVRSEDREGRLVGLYTPIRIEYRKGGSINN